MDTDGLICAGEGLAQVTWMDVRVGEILPTPRHGKPVEINAYWYNALKIMETFTEEAETSRYYAQLAEKVRDSFTEKFWMSQKNCLKDLVSGTEADTQIRCNQIWALSMPFTMLEPEKERKIVETVLKSCILFMGCVHWKKQIRNFIHTMKERWKSGIWHTIRALYGRSHWGLLSGVSQGSRIQ